jgi:hypothetical protein
MMEMRKNRRAEIGSGLEFDRILGQWSGGDVLG